MPEPKTVRRKELASLKSSLTGAGAVRCILIHGDHGIGKSNLLANFGRSFPGLNDWHIWMEVDGDLLNTPETFCSAMIRSMVAGNSVSVEAQNAIAREFGQLAVQVDRKNALSVDGSKKGDQLANLLIELLGKRLGAIHSPTSQFIPVLAFDNLDRATPQLVDWFVGPFNRAIRKSELFKQARFLFAAQKYNTELQSIFDRFGLAQVRQLKLEKLNSTQCAEINQQTYNRQVTSGKLYENSEGNPLKLLNFLKNLTISNKEDIILDTQTPSATPSDLSQFSEKEIERLSFAAYPERINRYNLEFFCSQREAAFCFNWLKRNSKLCNTEQDGDLILHKHIRDAALTHCEFVNSDLHQKNVIAATVLSAYLELFPDPENHWVPINLQVFDSFNNSLINNIFDPFQAETIISFIDEHAEQFATTNNQICLTDDAKLVTRRFIEVGGGRPIEGLTEKALQQWELDLAAIRKKKLQLEQEKINITEEVAGIEKQISHFSDMKDLVTNAMNKPRSSNKAKKELTFSMSKSLIAIGLTTVALSVISSMFGIYHAATGIALTLFGFFWPSIQITRPNMAEQGLNPKLALETQQHSISHRINGLTSRVSTLNNSLIGISDTIAESEDDTLIPYVSSKQESE